MRIPKPQPKVRLLIVEDDEHRLVKFRAWLPAVRIVWAGSAGAALRILDLDCRRDRPSPHHGILLDFDLDLRNPVAGERRLTGGDVALRIVERVPRDVRIFVHSMNPEFRGPMSNMLENEGFSTTLVPMSELVEDQSPLLAWYEEIREEIEESLEDEL